MAPNPETTQRRLISAGEALFASKGVDAVSVREITMAAGVRNTTALQYHFGDQAGLLRAVLMKHHEDVEQRRHALLDEYESGSDGDLRTLVAAFVRPIAAKLGDPDGGRDFLRIIAQLVNRPDFSALESTRSDPRDSTYRWRGLVGPHLSDVAIKRLHHRFTAIRVTFIELARRAEMPKARSDKLFVSHLIDLVTALLEAPISAETAQLIEESSRRRKT